MRIGPSYVLCLTIVFLWLAGNFSLSKAAPADSRSATEANNPATYEEEGWQAFQRGALDKAVSNWLEAVRIYQTAGKIDEHIDLLINLGDAYQALGQYNRAFKSLAWGKELADKTADRAKQTSVLAGLGNLHLATGPADMAYKYLTESLSIAREMEKRELTAVILNNLGNLFFSEKKYRESIEAYTESATIAKESGNQVVAANALINAGAASIQIGQIQEAVGMLKAALPATKTMAPSSDKLFALVNIALAYDDLRHRLADSSDSFLLVAAETLQEALALAETLGDRRGQSYVLGYLGKLYEGERRYEDALQLTRRAVFAAQEVTAPESLYRWQWQTGRLLKAQGHIDEAISAYRRAVITLQSIRQEMSRGYGASRVTFRESIGLVYFELVDLLLKRSGISPKREEYEPYLIEARNTVELLKAAELRDYFHDDCVDMARSRVKKLDLVSQSAVVVYPIILPDRLELLLSLPTGLRRFSVPVGADILVREVREFRSTLEKRNTREYLPHAQKLYEWLIKPFQKELDSLNGPTLVFVPDGPLRTIPMAALHDGEQFLVAKYPVATTPGLDLTDPRPLKRENVKLLAAGVSESVRGFPALPFVLNEIEAIQSFYQGNKLLNRDFLVATMEKELKNENFNIVHIASHGQFAADADKSFIVTFDDKDELTMNRLDQYVGLFRFRDDPLELLVLSACETAAGDDRAALGLAGIAIKAGARTALATLWFINDRSTSVLITEFYRHLQDPQVSRAVALQRAQLKLLEERRYQHPGYWSAFLLINNWL